jgi:phosphoglycerol transferase
MNGRRLAWEASAVGAVALLVALWVVRIWEIDLRVPVLYEWDALLHLALIENLREGSWYFWANRLAAPFGQDVRDYPMGGENIHWLILKLLAMVTPNAAATATVYLVLTYVLVAVLTYVVARMLRLGSGAAAVVAMLFAFLPFHQMRWTMHLLRSGYYPVPLAGLAILWVLDWRRELIGRRIDGGTGWRRMRVAFVLATGVLLGSSDTQNALYAPLLLAPLALLVAVSERDLRPLTLALAFGVMAGGALALNNLPYFLARAARGPNPEAFTRKPIEQEIYGLRLARLVAPVEGHRLAPFAAASAAVANGPPGEAGQSLGAIGTVGFVIGLAAVGAAAFGRPLVQAAPVPLARLGMLMLTGVLWATVGGFSYLLSVAGLTQYRTWNRISLWIALFALLAVGSVLQRLFERVGRRSITAVIVGVVIAVGLLDQVPGTIRSFDPQRLAREWHADAAFFQQAEHALPPGAMVFEFPVMLFPEPGRVRRSGIPFEHFKPYLHTTALRFSYGGMAGRPESTWSENLDALGPAAATALIALAGFDGAFVDRRAYPDKGAQLERAMASVGATLVVADAAQERTVWDLRPVRDRLGAAAGPERPVAQALFNPLRVRFGDRFSWQEQDDQHHWRWTSASVADFRIDGGDAPRRIVVTATLAHIDPAATTLTVTAADQTFTLPLAHGPAAFVASLELPRGGITLHLAANGQVQRSARARRWLGIQVRDLVVVDAVLLQRLCAGGIPVPVPCDALTNQPAGAT